MSLIHIDSKNRIAGGSFYDFTVSIDIPDEPVSQCVLADFVMPQTAPNIVAPHNVFYYTEKIDGVDTEKSVTFPEGQYDQCAFLDMYQSLMDANTTYSFEDEHCYTTELLSYAPFIGFKAPESIGPPEPSWIIKWSKMPELAYLLGFEPVDSALGRETIWSTFAYNFSPDNFVYMKLSPGFPSCSGTVNAGTTPVPTTFPISLYSNGGVVSKFDQRFSIDVGPNLFRDSVLRVQLFRRNGAPLKIMADWGFTLIVG